MKHLTTPILLFTLLCGSVLPAANEAKKPNILIILVDDMGYGDPACFNPQSKIPTPHIDRLASQGMCFTDAHTADSLCTPSRYALLTGRYCWRSRLKAGVLPQLGKTLIEPDRPTLPKMLKSAGYRTACIGKWHLGWDWPKKDATSRPGNCWRGVDLSRPIGGGPLGAGFDEYYGLDLPSSPLVYIENDRVVSPMPLVHMKANMYGGGAGGVMEKGFKQEDMQPRLTQRIIDYLRDHKKNHTDHPFFLYASFVSPHAPVVPTAGFIGKSQASRWGDYVCQTDHHIGEILAALDDTGLAENTLVLFTSDNGSPDITGTGPFQDGPLESLKERTGHLTNGHWRGNKGAIWEGGHRVPFIARFPGAIPAGTTSRNLLCLSDLYATIAHLTSQKVAPQAAEDSLDLWNDFLDPHAPAIRQSLVSHAEAGTFAIRQGTWKLIPDELGSGSVYSKPRIKKPGPNDPQGQLYNLATDPGEKSNLYSTHPQVVEELRSLLSKIQHNKEADITRLGY